VPSPHLLSPQNFYWSKYHPPPFPPNRGQERWTEFPPSFLLPESDALPVLSPSLILMQYDVPNPPFTSFFRCKGGHLLHCPSLPPADLWRWNVPSPRFVMIQGGRGSSWGNFPLFLMAGRRMKNSPPPSPSPSPPRRTLTQQRRPFSPRDRCRPWASPTKPGLQ